MLENQKDDKRLKILSDKEISEIYDLPQFTSEEQIKYFELNPEESLELQSLRSIKSKTYFILQLGYFKAKKLFFSFNLT